MDKRKTGLSRIIKTIGEDGEEYNVYEHQEYLFHSGMSNSGTWLKGWKSLELENGDPVNGFSDKDGYDFHIVIPYTINLKIVED